MLYSLELSGQLTKMSMKNSGEVAQLSSLIKPTKIVFDWITNNVYILENSKEIRACNFDILKCAFVYRSDNDVTIKGLALDPVLR